MEEDNNTRSFSYALPTYYDGATYPSTVASVEDNSGIVQNRKVFADANGEYFAIDNNGRAIPVFIGTAELPEVVVTAPRNVKAPTENMLSDSFNKYLTNYYTLSNDNTMTLNAPHREYNIHLKDRALNGAKSNALWEKEHPTLTKWGYALGAAPFAVASIPFVGGAAEYAAGTALGQGITNGLGYIANAASKSTLLPWLDAAATSYFGANGLQNVRNGNLTPETAMDLMPLGRVGKSIYDTGRSYFNLGKSLFRGKTGLNPTSTISITNNTAHVGQYNYPLRGKSEIPILIKRRSAHDYMDFINSEEYKNRLQNAGLENHWDFMKDLTSDTVDRLNYFPGMVRPTLPNPKALGRANSTPTSPTYGIMLKEDLKSDEIKPILDHEVSHFATAGAGIEDSKNLKNPNFLTTHDANYIGDIMRYNESIAPNISWEDVKLPELMKDKSISIGELSKENEIYNYLTDPQEKRAKAYSIYQQAKEAGMSTDEFVDKYTKDGEIIDTAPMQMQQMGDIFTLNDLKKYLRNFLSIATPVSITKSNKE